MYRKIEDVFWLFENISSFYRRIHVYNICMRKFYHSLVILLQVIGTSIKKRRDLLEISFLYKIEKDDFDLLVFLHRRYYIILSKVVSNIEWLIYSELLLLFFPCISCTEIYGSRDIIWQTGLETKSNTI
jgi:hypothetical protein